MSFESGKRLGSISCWIGFLVPIISIVLSPITAILAPIRINNGHYTINAIANVVPTAATTALTITGFVLFILATNRLSTHYNEPGIYKNGLYASTLNIIMAIVSLIGALATLNASPAATLSSLLNFFVTSFLPLYLIRIVLGIISGVFFYFAFNKLAERSGLGNFRTVGLLFLIGEVLTIVLIGGLLVWIAWLLAALAFNSVLSLKSTPQVSYSSVSVTQTEAFNIGQRKFCPYCGTSNRLEAGYCQFCGRKLQ